MKNNMKEIYVLITIFNNINYIEECIDSINNNTINCKIILGIDGCEPTKQKVESIMYKYDNLKVVYFKENKGTYITINSLIEMTPNDCYIQIFGSDDIMYNNMLYNMYNNSPCYSEYSGISMLHKSIYNNLGGYMPWRMAADTEFRQRLKRFIKNYKQLPSMFKYRQHQNNITKSQEYGLKSKLRKEYINYIESTKYDSTIYIDRIINDNYEILKEINEKKEMIVVGIATMNSRKKTLNQVIQRLKDQTLQPDKIFIYNNDENKFNATDNGKFYPLTILEEDCIFLSMDDDILYPFTYIEDMVKAVKQHNCIVTHHGRKLNGIDVPYYTGHKSYSCLRENNIQDFIDVAGTGVTAFRTSYFKPKNIFYSEYKRMSDIVFSLAVAQENKQILLLKHNAGYLKDICEDVTNSCFANESKNQNNQIKLCNEIYLIKNKK